MDNLDQILESDQGGIFEFIKELKNDGFMRNKASLPRRSNISTYDIRTKINTSPIESVYEF